MPSRIKKVGVELPAQNQDAAIVIDERLRIVIRAAALLVDLQDAPLDPKGAPHAAWSQKFGVLAPEHRAHAGRQVPGGTAGARAHLQ